VPTSAFSDVTVNENAASTVVPLSGHFDNTDITGTIVQFKIATTNNGPTGNVNIELFDQAAPNSVANFLSYLNSSAYNNTFFHRVEKTGAPDPSRGGAPETISIVQGGGFLASNASHIATPAFQGDASTTLTFSPTDATGGTITRSSGSWTTDGFAVKPGIEQWITVAGAPQNAIYGMLTAADATTLTLTNIQLISTAASGSMNSEIINNTASPSLSSPAQGVTYTFTFAPTDSSSGTITRNSGSFLTNDHFVVGQVVTVQTLSGDPNSDLSGHITALTDTVMTLSMTNKAISSETLSNTGGGSFQIGITAGVNISAGIVNEFDASRPNAAGTLAMARTGTDINTATSEFFFNTQANPGLDDPANRNQYAVLGHIINPTGLTIVNQIDNLTQENVGGAFSNLPVAPGAANPPQFTDLVKLTSASVINKIVTFGAQSSNTSLVTVAGSGNNLTLNYVPGATGTSVITVTAIDASGQQAQTTVNVTVNGSHISVKDGNTTLTDNQASAINFGSAQIDMPLQHTFTITNSGNQILNLGSATLPAGFTFVQAPPSTIAPNQSADIIIAADTSTAGIFSGTLTLPSDDPTTPVFHIKISAQVAQPDIAISYNNAAVTSGQTLDLGTLLTGNSVTINLHVTNNGTVALNLSAVTIPAGYSVVQALPASLAIGSSAVLPLAVDTSSPGTRAGTLTIPSDDPDTPKFNIDLTAQVFFDAALGAGGARSVRFTDADNTITTVRLVGPGSATILFNGQNPSKMTTSTGVTITGSNLSIHDLTLDGTTRASQLLFSVSKGNGQVNVDMIDGSALGSIVGRGVDVSTSINLPGLAMLTLTTLDSAAVTIGSSMGALNFSVANVVDSTIHCDAAFSQLRAITWTDAGSDNMVSATSIGVMDIASGFDSPLALSGTGQTITNATIRGALAGGAWTSAGRAAKISAGSTNSAWSASFAGAITSFSTKGNFSSNLTAAGITNLSIGGSIVSANITTSGMTNHVTVHNSISGSNLKATGGFGSIVANTLADSRIYAAVDPSSGLLPGVSTEFSSVNRGRIGLVNVHNFSDSAIAAADLGTLILGRISTSNGGTPEGVAGFTLAVFDATTTPGGKKIHLTKKNTATQASVDAAAPPAILGDFKIKIIKPS